MAKYRCFVVCDKCGRGYVTQKMDRSKAPARCKHCTSSMTRAIRCWRV